MLVRDGSLRRLILIGDAALVVIAMVFAAGLQTFLRRYFGWFKDPPSFDQYAVIVYAAIPVWLGLVAILGLHRTFERTWTRLGLIVDLVKLHALGFVALSAVLFFTQSTINRSLVVLFLGCTFVLSYSARSALGMWRRYQHGTGQTRTRVLLVGDSPELAAFAERISTRQLPPTVVGSLGSAPVGGLAYRGTLADIERVLHEEALDQVLFFPPHHEPAAVADALRACEVVGVAAGFAIQLVQPTDAPPQVLEVFDRPFLAFEAAPKSPERLAIKHGFDWIAALVGVIVLSPLLLFVAIAIVISMGRPVFFRQARAGLHGREFQMLKFRTMVADAEARRAALADKNEMTGPVFKVTNDPRVTRLGRFLRKTSIDELPQLFNVISGAMSLVGPRPLPIKEQQGIRGWHRRRLSMKPGITGIWQISGRSNIDFEEWMRLDEKYVGEWSLRLDLVILGKTLPAVLFGRGAK